MSKPKIHLLIALLSGLLLTGCFSESKREKVVRQWHDQTCEMCGAVWSVSPLNPSEQVPPTIEWCFNDGHFCEEGFSLYIALLEKDQSAELTKDWIDHCRKCSGCKCATFKPKQWREVVDNVQ